ncbi:MAG: 4-(cytidine 5'-diphospho)-2-C-methyl-D-erythritol kinase [Campylobacterales bacterium]|nr:4-(cytidine 5'-diphospho)-2-C-methyl-D-erythritol kinase [Campylobacterales bacterium]
MKEMNTPTKTYKSFAKVNIFLKIVGFKDGYHQIVSRFVLVDSLYDVMWFEQNDGNGFDVVGEFDCPLESNTIYKAYKALTEHVSYQRIEQFCKTHKVVVYKNIPAFAGLGGGSSNAAMFLNMINEELNLRLSLKELIEIGKDVGADVPFFITKYKSANVRGFGEIVEEFDEEVPQIKTFTPNVKCDTTKIYRLYRKDFSKNMSQQLDFADMLSHMDSREILEEFSPEKLNDLFQPALKSELDLELAKKDGWFFSGSGSSFFTTT